MRELKRMGMEKGKEKGQGREINRERQENYIAVCKNQFKTCEAKRNGCVS